jgi:hypothetical protein
VFFIIVGKGQPLKMVEQILAHIRFHPGAHDMPPGSNVILAEVFDDVQDEQGQAHVADGFQNEFLIPGEEILAQIIENLRKGQIHSRNNHGTEHIGIKKKAVRLIVMDELFQDLHSRFSTLPKVQLTLQSLINQIKFHQSNLIKIFERYLFINLFKRYLPLSIYLSLSIYMKK